jgi:arginine deiminase
MQTNNLANLDTVFTVLDSIISYAEKVARHEAESAIIVKINELNEEIFKKDSKIFAEITKDYHLKKFKLERFQKRVEKLSPEYQALISPLIESTERKVKELQEKRENITKR